MATEDGFHGYISTGCLQTGHSEIKKPCSSLKNNAVVSEVKTCAGRHGHVHRSSGQGGGSSSVTAVLTGDHCASSSLRVAPLCTVR